MPVVQLCDCEHCRAEGQHHNACVLHSGTTDVCDCGTRRDQFAIPRFIEAGEPCDCEQCSVMPLIVRVDGDGRILIMHPVITEA